MRLRRLPIAVAGGALLLGSCTESPTEVSCDIDQPFPASAIGHLTPDALRAMLTDAAARAAPVVLAVPAPLQAEMAVAANSIDAPIAACRGIERARDLLAAAPDNPATRPDRDVITLALDLAASYVATK